jgi:cell fate regulator YaaT (PSP1 superfamily)
VDVVDYLVAYGLDGAFGRFRPVRPLPCCRGDAVVVHSPRGLERGEVLREATAGHARFLPNTTLGQLLRRCEPADDAQDQAMRQRAQLLLQRASELAAELALPVELLDAEVLLDGEHAILHYLRLGDGDPRPLVSSLSRQFAVTLSLHDLAAPVPDAAGCGHCGPGGCGSCGTGGGCGTCGTAAPEEVQAYFAGLRQQIDRRHSLL